VERRFVAFLAISFLVLMVNSILVAPPPKPPGAEEQDRGEQVDGPDEPLDQQAVDVVDDAPPIVDQRPVDALPPAEDLPEVGLEYVTLGSVAQDSPYRMLVTLTNQGAGVRRLELANPRYRDLQDRGGYLGQLEAVADPAGGILVQAVGAGTPAESAGLQRGDRIVSAGPELAPIAAPEELAKLLAGAKPSQTFALQVVRGNGEPIDLAVHLLRRPLELVRPESENILMRTDRLPNGFVEPPSFLMTLEQVGAAKIDEEAEEIVDVALRTGNWEVAHRDANSVEFRMQLPRQQVEVIKRYRIEPVPDDQQANANYPGYGLTLEVEITNLAQGNQPIAYRLDGPNGLPIEGWWYAHKISRKWSASGIRDVVGRFVGGDPVEFSPATVVEEVIEESSEPMQGNPLAFIGVDAQYFSVVMLPEKESLEEKWIDETRTILLGPPPKARSGEERYANISCRLISQPQSLASGEKLTHRYSIFAGPKRPELLSQYQACDSKIYTLSDMLYYGWFGPVARAMLAILHFFYGIVGNYGVAIILLTVLVRSCMFPISRKQALSMAKMQELRPEMDRLKEKYKGDMQKQSQATQELYRKNGVNPLAGCLPALIQLPIFLGLYRALMVDVELRQAPLLGEGIRWCSNLAAPDMFFNWSGFMPEAVSSGVGIFGLGPYLNVLPLVTVALFLMQQMMFTPEPANEQAALQQKIMKYMMLLIGFLFFKVAAGLCIYFIASSSWGIAERKLLPKAAASTASGPTPSEKSEVKDRSAPRASKNGHKKGKKPSRSKSKRRR